MGETKAAGRDAEVFASLQKDIDALGMRTLGPEDWRLRVAGVAATWNVFQHFHPYLDQVGVD